MQLNGTKDDISGNASRTQDWSLDALGNWDSVTDETSTTQTRTHDDQNRITAVSSATTPTHSANGEMTGDETGNKLVYDAWGRLVKVTDSSDVTISEYAYDALARRISQDDTGLYYSQQWQVLEERNSSGNATHQYVWSPVYVDAMVLRDRDTDPNTAGLEERVYAVHDANFNITALVDASGAVIERYLYDPYGERMVLDANWAADADGLSDVAFAYGHQGGRHDLDVGLVHFRNRDLDTSLGRWYRQDPIGYIDGVNLYGTYDANPANRVDPSGEVVWMALCCTTAAVLSAKRVVEAISSRACSGLTGKDLLFCHLRNILDMGGVSGLSNCMVAAVAQETWPEKIDAIKDCLKGQGAGAAEDIALFAALICCLGNAGKELIKRMVPTPPAPAPVPVAFCDQRIDASRCCMG